MFVDMKEVNFSNSIFNGVYLEKVVVYRINFLGIKYF